MGDDDGGHPVTQPSPPSPPRIARALLTLLLPGRDRRYALADLEEEFERRVARDGETSARRWYRSQVVRSAPLALMGRLRGWGRTTTTRRTVGSSRGGGGEMMGIRSFAQDIRYALRTLARAPMTVLITVVSLGVGLGAVTTVFTVADQVLRVPAPWLRDPESLVTLYTSDDDGEAWGRTSYADMEDAKSSGALAQVAGETVRLLSLEQGDRAEPLMAEVVTGNYFDVTGIQPVVGRAFTADEGAVGSGAAVGVIGYALWSDRFGGDPSVVGRTVRVAGQPLTVVGVAPKGVMARGLPVAPDLWVPLGAPQAGVTAESLLDRNDRRFIVIGRLRDGADLAALQAQLAALADRLSGVHPESWTDHQSKPRTLSALPERDSRLNPNARMALSVAAVFFFAVTGLVLLIACANVTSLFLVRAVRRGGEVALRLALGASRLRIVRLLLAEGLVLGLAAGTLGVVFAKVVAAAMRSFSLPFNVPFRLDFEPGGAAYAFAFGVAMLTSLLFSLVPALRVSRPSLTPALKEGTRGGGNARRRFSPASMLVSVQFAASLVLVVGAGLFLRSLQGAAKVDLGVDPDGVAVTSRTVPADVTDAGLVPYYHDIEDRLAGVPGASAAALSSGLELTFMQIGADMSVRSGAVDEPEAGRAAARNAVTPGYLEMLRVPLLRGRTIGQEDGPGDARVAVVNETFARTFWPGEDALGRSFTVLADASHGGDRTYQVVGLTADGRYIDVDDPPSPYFWTSLYQDPSRTVVVSLKGADADAMAQALRTRVERAPGESPVMPSSSYASQLSLQFLHLRIMSKVLGWGGAFGLFLALIGVYGVVSFTVAQRTRELAIRRAVGADGAQVVGSMLRHGLWHAVGGLVVGLAVLIPAARLLRGLLIGVGPADPVAMVSGVLLLLATATLASLVPARRAARIDPMTALREE